MLDKVLHILKIMAPTGKTLGRKLGAGLPDESFKVRPRKNGW